MEENNQKNHTLLTKLKLWYSSKSRNTKIGMWIIAFVALAFVFDDGNKSSSNPNGSTQACSYCGTGFSGLGWYHIGERCEQENGNGWKGTHCSAKCCDDDWAKNGINSH